MTINAFNVKFHKAGCMIFSPSIAQRELVCRKGWRPLLASVKAENCGRWAFESVDLQVVAEAGGLWDRSSQ